ncbi:MAG: molybdopterin oxidoreductase family protein [Acidimicrobiales bacterium]|nr:molybdopterin oxidoreductase family protein [Acidimicrobiales bacterium]
MTDTAGADTAAATETHFRTCPLCEATCGLEITTRGAEVVRIRGDRDDVFSHGFLCPKGSTLKQLHTDPDRLRRPQIRRGEGADATWEEVGWDEAFAEIERRLLPLLDEHGRDAVALYLGNPTVHNLGAGIYARALITALGSRNLYSASTVDQMPRHVSCGAMYGSPDTIPVPDLDRTSYLLMLGANPYESNGSLCTAPDFPGRLEAIRARGGRVVVVDPRRTRTAKNADEHVPIRPGTDGHLLLAMVHTLFAEDLVSAGLDPALYSGVDAVRDAVEPFSPEAVADHTGVGADTIRRLAREVAAAESAAVYGRIGTNTVAFGTVASWATDLVTALTGNLDRDGGMMFPLALTAARGAGKGRGFTTGRSTSRVKGHPEVRSEYPIATLADEIQTAGEGQVRALITFAGNPARSAPNSGRLDAALATLDFMVCIDPYRNETTRHADVILPPPDALQKSHYDLAFNTLAVRNVANYSPPVFPVDPAEQPAEHTILARLALVLSGMGATADPAVIDGLVLDRVLGRATKPGGVAEGRTTADLVGELVADDGPEQVLEAMIRTGAYGDGFGADPDGVTFQTLIDHPHGLDLGPLGPRLPEVLKTPSGQVELAPAAFLADLPRMLAAMDEPRDGRLTLIGRRHVRSNNSWMHNVDVLVKGKERCTLQVHPDDAARLGLRDGGRAEVVSRVGQVVAPVEVTDEILAGVVSLPHGWGHDAPGTAMAVAEAHAGVNANALTDDAPLDPLSGNAVLNGVPVTVAPA